MVKYSRVRRGAAAAVAALLIACLAVIAVATLSPAPTSASIADPCPTVADGPTYPDGAECFTVTAEPTSTPTKFVTLPAPPTPPTPPVPPTPPTPPAATVTATATATATKTITQTPRPSVSITTATPAPSVSISFVSGQPLPVVPPAPPVPNTVVPPGAALPVAADPQALPCTTPPILGLPCIPQIPAMVNPLAGAQPAGLDTPTAFAIGAVGLVVLLAIGTAIWVVKRNADHGPSRKQKRKRKRRPKPDSAPTPPNDDTQVV